MRLGMTKAMYKIGKTYEEMVKLHEKEIRNHENLAKAFIKASGENEGKNDEERTMINTIYLMEAKRNLDHKKCHEEMRDFYRRINEDLR